MEITILWLSSEWQEQHIAAQQIQCHWSEPFSAV